MNKVCRWEEGDELLTYKDLQATLHIGKNRAYELLKSACFPSIRINNRYYVTRENLSKWIQEYTFRQFLI